MSSLELAGQVDPKTARATLGLLRQLARADNDHRDALTEAAAEGIDWDLLGYQMARQRLLGILGARLLAAAGADVPDTFATAVRAALEEQQRRAVANAVLTWSLLSELEAAGVRAMPLKGPFLSERLHGDMAFRASDDVDLLVSPLRMSEAIRALERIGGARPRQGDDLPQLHHHFVLGDGIPIELHWRITWFEAAYTDTLLGRAVRHDDLWVPAPADELISLLLFHARDGLAGLRAPVDIAACWQRSADGATIGAARGTIAEFPALARATAVAALSVDRVLGTNIAAELAINGTRRGAVAVELTDWALRRRPGDIDLATKLVDGLTSPKGGLGAFTRRAFLPRLQVAAQRRRWEQLTHALALAVRLLLATGAIAKGSWSRGTPDRVLQGDPLRLGPERSRPPG